MRLRRIVTASGTLVLAAALTLVTSSAASAEAPAAEQAVAESSSGVAPMSVDSDGLTFNVYCGGSLYGTVGWNDYANANPSDDIDNVVVIDRKGDGRSLRVSAYNQSTSRSAVGHATYGDRVSIETGNLRDAGDPYVLAAAYPWDDGSADCSPVYFRFYE